MKKVSAKRLLHADGYLSHSLIRYFLLPTEQSNLGEINAYISQHTESNSRRQKLRQNLSNLFDRVSAGVHTDVTADEAFSLFLNVYLFLGEVLQLGAVSASVLPEIVQE
jgi:hypothetical protein